ncbi:MAG: dockerin type I domain-containing protein, partial [Desulfobacteraceae bacterium]
MSDEKKISNNEDQFLTELEASRTGEEHDLSTFKECMNSLKSQALDDLEQISGLFSGARPDPGEIPDSVDNLVLGHIRQKSRKIRREKKVVRLFPRYRWAAAAVMGILVFMVSYGINKTDIPENVTINNGNENIRTESADNADSNKIREALYHNSREHKLVKDDSKDVDGNGRINIIDAYLMDRRLMSGVAMPKKMDLNGDGNIDREDI